MAKIGLEYSKVAKLTEENGTPVYTNGTKLGASVKFSAKINTKNASFYADNMLWESDKSFKEGNLSIEVDDLLDDVRELILAHKLSDEREVISNKNDSPQFVGFGCIGKVVRRGIIKYRAVWFYKVQFSEPTDESETEGENTKYSTSQLEGTIYSVEGGNYKADKIFDTVEEAKGYIDNKAGITSAVPAEPPAAPAEPTE